MTTAYFLFGLCGLAFVVIAIISMVGGDDTTSKAMKERLERRAAKQSRQESQQGTQQGSVTSMPTQDGGRSGREAA